MEGFTLWFTGLSGSGKSTLAERIKNELIERGMKVELLDGDEFRTTLSKGLGFSKEDRDTNIRRIGYVAKLLSRNGVVAITAAISPYRDTRNEQRQKIGRFFEVYTECDLDTLEARDVKGLYKKARAGQIKNFTGVDDPYEPPTSPEVHCNTAKEEQDVCFDKILAALEERGWIAKAAGDGIDQAAEAAAMRSLKAKGFI
ncbi:MAG: adenylyl-sulfate kinase [Planctomycetes bacterium]|nr:adenylyl-sulfate kinase [Planctomycetota bacterium]